MSSSAVDILRSKLDRTFIDGSDFYQSVEIIPSADLDSFRLSYSGEPTTGMGIWLDLSDTFAHHPNSSYSYFYPSHDLLGSTLVGSTTLSGNIPDFPFLMILGDVASTKESEQLIGYGGNNQDFDLLEFGSAQLSRITLPLEILTLEDDFVNNTIVLPDGSSLTKRTYDRPATDVLVQHQANLAAKGISIYIPTEEPAAGSVHYDLVVPSSLASQGDLKFTSDAVQLVSSGGEILATEITPADPFDALKIHPIGVRPEKQDISSSGFLLEYSDSVTFPSLVRPDGYFDSNTIKPFGETVSSAVSIVNDSVDGDHDYVVFNVPTGEQFESLVLQDFVLVDSTQTQKSTLDFSLTAIGADGKPSEVSVASGTFGVSDIGKSLHEIASISPLALSAGQWLFEVEPTSGFPASQEAAYGFRFGPGLEIDMSGVLLQQDEDALTPFSLSLPTQTTDSKSLSWSVSNLPSGLTHDAAGVISGSLDPNFNTQGKGSASVASPQTVTLVATAEGVSKSFDLPFSVLNTPDAPVLTGLVADYTPFVGVEDVPLEISYADLFAKVGSGYEDADGDRPLFVLQASPDLPGSIRIGASNLDSALISSQPSFDAVSDYLEPGDSLYVELDQDVNSEVVPLLQNAFNLSVYDLALDQIYGSAPLPILINATPDAPISPAVQIGDFIEGDAYQVDSLTAADPDFASGIPITTHSYLQTSTIPGFVLSTDGGWSFDPSNAVYDKLSAGERLTQTVQYTISDVGFTGTGSDQPPVQGSFNFDVIGTNDAPNPFIPASLTAPITENNSVTRDLPKNDFEGSSDPASPDYDRLQYAISSTSVKPAGFTLDEVNRQFTYDPSGAGYEQLPVGAVLSESVLLDVVDSKAASSSIQLDFTVNGVNDLPSINRFDVVSAHADGRSLKEGDRFEFTVADLLAYSDASDVDQPFNSIINGTDQNLTFKFSAVTNTGSLFEILPDQPDVRLDFSNDTSLFNQPLDPAKTYAWQTDSDLNGLQWAFSLLAFDGLAESSNPVQVKFDLDPVDDQPGLAPTTGNYTYSVQEQTAAEFDIDVLNSDLNGLSPDRVALEFAPGGNANGQFELVSKSTDQWTLKFNPADRELPGSSKPALQSFTASVIAVDSDAQGQRGLASAPVDFTVSLNNSPDQVLSLTAEGIAQTLKPSDTSINLDLDYQTRGSSGAAIEGPSQFSATLSFDSALTLSTHSLDPKISVGAISSSNGRSVVTLSSSSLDDFTVSSKTAGIDFGGLTFVRSDDPSLPLDPRSYSFDLALDKQSGFENLTDSIVISPQASGFIGLYQDKVFDLVDFDTPLSVDTSAQSVMLKDPAYSGFTLDYSSPAKPFDTLKLTRKDDIVTLDRPLTVLLDDGDDTIDFSPLTTYLNAYSLDVSLGKGKDTIKLPQNSSLDALLGNSQQLNVSDFELGFDRLDTPGGLIQRRDQVIDFAGKHQALDLDFAPIAINLDRADTFTASIADTVFSEATPLIGSSVALDPGSSADTVQLRVSLSDAPAAAELVLLEAPSNSVWTWSALQPGDHSAVLSFNPASDSAPIDALKELREAASALGVKSSINLSSTKLEIQWLSTGDPAPRDSFSKQISVQASSPSTDGGIDFASSSEPINLTLSLSKTNRDVAAVHASSKSDRVVLLSEAFDDGKTDSVFAAAGDDLIEVGDGDAGHGEFGNDRLIAMAGTSTTQLFGGQGDDLLIGAQGDDLFAGAGDDVLAVRGQGSFLWGQGGRDTFVLLDDSIRLLSPGAGMTRVKDFDTTDDLINIHSARVTSMDQLNITRFGRRSTQISIKSSLNHHLGSSSFAVIENIRPDQLSASNFSFTQNSLIADNLSRVASIDQFI